MRYVIGRAFGPSRSVIGRCLVSHALSGVTHLVSRSVIGNAAGLTCAVIGHASDRTHSVVGLQLVSHTL